MCFEDFDISRIFWMNFFIIPIIRLFEREKLVQWVIDGLSEIVFWRSNIIYVNNQHTYVHWHFIRSYVRTHQLTQKFKGIIIMYDMVVDKCGKYVYNTCLGLKNWPSAFSLRSSSSSKTFKIMKRHTLE